MRGIGLRQLSILLLGIGMISVGALGMTGQLQARSVLLGVVIIVTSLVSYYVGQMTSHPS